jgi:GTP-binding protein
MPFDDSDPVENYIKINRELAMYSEELGRKPQVLVLNKIDLDPDGTIIKDILSRLGTQSGMAAAGPMMISAVSGEGITQLNETLWKTMKGKTNESDRD